MTNTEREAEGLVDDLAAVLLAARHVTLTEWRWDRVTPARRTEAREQARAALRWFADSRAVGRL